MWGQERFYSVNRNEDRFAIAVMLHGDISLGTFPEQFHTWCFIQNLGNILCEVTGNSTQETFVKLALQVLKKLARL